jgi:hypothetical protein
MWCDRCFRVMRTEVVSASAKHVSAVQRADVCYELPSTLSITPCGTAKQHQQKACVSIRCCPLMLQRVVLHMHQQLLANI